MLGGAKIGDFGGRRVVRAAWKLILQFIFYSSIGGCSIHAARECKKPQSIERIDK